MHTEPINHDPAHDILHDGVSVAGRPSLGSWLAYGLGSENKDLPGVHRDDLRSGRNGGDQPLYDRLWGSGFLPSTISGRQVSQWRRSGAVSSNPPGDSSRDARRSFSMTLAELNRINSKSNGDPEIAHAHRAVRNGVPHAIVRAGADGSIAKSRRRRLNCMARMRASRERSLQLHSRAPAG